MTIIYTHREEDMDGGMSYFTTKEAAIKNAQEAADYYGSDHEVEQCIIARLPTRELTVALLRREGWCEKSEVVHICKPRRGALAA